MTKELTTKELLEALHGMYMSAEYFYNRGHGKKAYNQLRKMIEEHIALKGELADVKLTLAGLRIAEGKSPIEQSVTTNQQVEHKPQEGEVDEELIRKFKDKFYFCAIGPNTEQELRDGVDKMLRELLTQQGKPQKQVTRGEITEAWINNVAYEMSAMSLDNAVAYLREKLELRGLEVGKK